MKTLSLLLLVSATGLFAAEEAKPAATAPAPAAAAPAEAPKSTKVPGVSDEDYDKYMKARLDVEKNDPEVKGLKEESKAAKAKVKSATTDEEKATANKQAKVAEKAFIDARRAAVMKRYPELNEAGNKISDFWNKESAKKKAAAQGKAAPETK
jgi:hypothetical protein